MTKSCVNFPLFHWAGGIAAVLAVVAAVSGAFAQERPPAATGAPVVLAPPRPLAPLPPRSVQESPAPRAPAANPSPYGTASPPREVESQGIRVDTLGEIDADSVGALDSNSGGFGVDLWKGSSIGTVTRLLALLKHPLALPTARSLSRRLLLSAARPPRAKDGTSGHGGGHSLLAQRLRTLLAMGDVRSAKALLRVVPVHVSERAIGLVKMRVAFLINDKGGACGEARAGVVNYDGVPWRKAMVYCQYLAGEGPRAGIGVELLREHGVKDDAFFTLAAILGGDNEATFKAPAKLEPLHLAMMRLARVEVSNTVVDSAKAAELRTIAFSPNAELDARLAAAERAEAVGALEAKSLAQIYGAVTFAPADVAAALTNVDSVSGPRGRALLYHAAHAQKVPAAQAEVMAKAFVLARTQGRLPTMVRVFLPLMESIRPTADLAWFAAEAARALYFVGRLQLAGQWESLATRGSSGQGSIHGAGIGAPPPPAVAPSATKAVANITTVKPGASSAAATGVGLWPYAAIAAAGAERKPLPAPAQPAPPGSQGSDAYRPGTAFPPGTATAPTQGPTAADALAGARSVERGPVLDLFTRPAVANETAQTTAKAPPFDSEMFSRWREALPAAEESVSQGQAALLLTLLDALGVSVPASAWLDTVGQVRELGALPQPGLVAALESSSKEGRVGETVLMALALLGTDTTEKLHPSVIGPVVRGLARVGLIREARALALEVAFKVGL